MTQTIHCDCILIQGTLAHTLRTRDCKCQWLVTHTQSHMGGETEPAKGEDRTDITILSDSFSDCQSLDTFEALLHHFMHFEISIQCLIISIQYLTAGC